MRDVVDGKDLQANISTQIEIEPKYFKNSSVSTRCDRYYEITDEIGIITSDLRKLLIEIQKDGLVPEPKLLKNKYLERQRQKRYETPKIKTFWDAYEEWLVTKKGKSRGYTKTLVTLQNRLKDFEKFRKTPIGFESIVGNTELFQSGLNNFLWEHKKLTNGYINKLYSSLSSFLFYAHQAGYIKRKPKIKTLGNVKKIEHPYLRTNEVLKLFSSDKWDYDKKKEKKLLKNKHIYLVHQELKGGRKDQFGGKLTVTNWELVKYIHLWCCSLGCRYSDVEHFRVNDFTFNREDKHMEWIQQKTREKNSVPINDISGYIFQKFSGGKSRTQPLFPKLSIQKFNKHLKLLLEDLGFNRLVSLPRMIGSEIINDTPTEIYNLISSHSGRHSFITNTIEMGTMDYKTIMSLSGHSTTSSFLGYVSVVENQRIKASELYKLSKTDEQHIEERLLKVFRSLPEDKKKTLISIVEMIGNQ